MKKLLLIAVAFLLIGYIFCLPRQLFHVPYSTVVMDREGELLGARIAEDGQWRFPEREIVPEKMKICITAFEDRYFYYHWGVNPLSIGRAFVQNLRENRVVSGGSTLTMQTIRLSRSRPRTIKEKIIEIILATRLEFRYSKNKILATYLSHAPFGGNVVGLNAASWRYYGHSAEYLSWAEAATLAVLPNSPAMIHLSRSRDQLLEKRNRLLAYLHEENILDESTYTLALSEPLPEEPLPLPQIAPHLVSYFHKKEAGIHHMSTIDKGLQLEVEMLLERWNCEFSRSDIHNMAALVIDVHSGQPLVYCGNVSFEKRWGNQVDVLRSPRSTGSILKPFLYYAALNEGDILPHTLLPDIPININGFSPQNFNLQYEGAVPASEAIARSLNIPAVQLLRQHSIPKFYSFLQQIGLTTLTKPSSHYGLSLILGGAEATLWEVSIAYTNMSRSLQGLSRIQPSLLMDKPVVESVNPFSRGAVWQVFDAIKEVNRPEEIDWRIIPSMQTIAWKTGTSYGFRDAWAVGVTSNYVVGVWVGNASGEGKPGLVGARTAGPVMFDIFNLLPTSRWFDVPYDEFVDVEVCCQSGHLCGRYCEEKEIINSLPVSIKTSTCHYHHRVTLTMDEKQRVYADCAEHEATVQRPWFTLPPVWAWYYKQHHPEYKELPPFKKGCGEDNKLPMQFIYPEMNAHIRLPKQLDGSLGQLTFELVHTNPQATIYWHLDDGYITSTQDFHKISLLPSLGKHSLTVVDNEGNSHSVTFYLE